MIFIIGISPKTKTLDRTPKICTRCGLAQAHVKRTDHYLSLFLIPLIRVKNGDPVIVCDRCEQRMESGGWEYFRSQTASDAVCPHCSRGIHHDFRYCPYCGKLV